MPMSSLLSSVRTITPRKDSAVAAASAYISPSITAKSDRTMSPSDDTALRHQLSRMLGGGRAFAEPERILRDIPQHARGVIVKGIGRSIWQVLEHIRID